MTEQFEIAAPVLKISGVFAAPEGQRDKTPCVIISHGLISSKESSKSVALAEAFYEAGIASCRFDYHGCGESEGILRDTTLTIRLKNLETAVAYIRDHRHVDAGAVGLLGSSFGGCTSLLHAARDKTIRCAILLATPHRLEKRPDDELDQMGFTDIYDDFSRYDLLAEARGVSHGLVIHGDRDETVPWEEGMEIYRNLMDPRRFELIKGGDHIFSAPADRDTVVRMAVDWFQRSLNV